MGSGTVEREALGEEGLGVGGSRSPGKFDEGRREELGGS